jgi:hypothetical protein
MRKILALAIVVTMLFALAIPAAAVVNMTANKATITLDGTLNEEYSGPYDIASGHRSEDGELLNPANAATGKVWTAWDETGLYFYVEVYDTTPNHYDFGAESLEVYIDWNAGLHDSDEATDEAPTWQIRVSPVDDQEMTGYSRDANGPNWSTSAFEDYIEWVIVPLNGSNWNDGYIVEMKINLPGFAGTLTEGRSIPMDFQVCDNITGDGRDAITFLGHIGEGIDDNSRWNTSAYYQGRVILGGVYVPQADDEPEAAAGGGEEADATTPLPRPTPRTGDAGVTALIALMAIAAAGIAVFRRKAVK